MIIIEIFLDFFGFFFFHNSSGVVVLESFFFVVSCGHLLWLISFFSSLLLFKSFYLFIFNILFLCSILWHFLCHLPTPNDSWSWLVQHCFLLAGPIFVLFLHFFILVGVLWVIKGGRKNWFKIYFVFFLFFLMTN